MKFRGESSGKTGEELEERESEDKGRFDQNTCLKFSNNKRNGYFPNGG